MKLFTNLRSSVRVATRPKAEEKPFRYQDQVEAAKAYLGSRYLLAEPVSRRGK